MWTAQRFGHATSVLLALSTRVRRTFNFLWNEVTNINTSCVCTVEPRYSVSCVQIGLWKYRCFGHVWGGVLARQPKLEIPKVHCSHGSHHVFFHRIIPRNTVSRMGTNSAVILSSEFIIFMWTHSPRITSAPVNSHISFHTVNIQGTQGDKTCTLVLWKSHVLKSHV